MPPESASKSRPPWVSRPAGLSSELTPQESRSFVLKLWVESTAQENAQPVWRGHITRVADRTVMYFKSLEEVSAYLDRQLTEMLAEGPAPPET